MEGGYGSAEPFTARKAHIGRGLPAEDLPKALACLILPPIIFAMTSTILCWQYRFNHERGAWLIAVVLATPAFFAVREVRRSAGAGETSRFLSLFAALLVAASVVASVVGELNYWYFAQPYYFLDSLRAYDGINPAEVDGVRLMDAGRVNFTRGARLAVDMGMSFTSWDIYCVAPITTSGDLLSRGATEGSMLASYDFWAVGVNCCNSGSQAAFRCGEYENPSARSGLRQVSAEQSPYFRLAVQQAEAEYNIEATHPLFFHWVQDPLREQGYFFAAAFSNLVLANSLHFGTNAFAVVCFMVLFNKASRGRASNLTRALHP